jgi:hypothetical protein
MTVPRLRHLLSIDDLDRPLAERILETARAFEMRTIGLVGFDGGMVCSMLDEPILVRTEPGAYGLVETAHAAIADIITSCLVSDTLPATVPIA